MLTASNPQIAVCLALTRAIGRTRTVEEIYSIALDALRDGLGVSRASILLFDPDGVMRFKAYRDLSEPYRRAVEGHTPWRPDSPDPQPIVVSDVSKDPGLAPYLPIIEAEGIAGMAFIPLESLGTVIGKFMLYFSSPRQLGDDELQLASVIASQVAFALERTRAEEQARLSEERLRFALDAASMGTWDWDLTTNTVRWSENLERIHGLPAGTFDGTFGSYEREIHPDDRAAVLASAERAVAQGTPHDVEYRIVAPDGTVRWCEGKGRVEFLNGKAVRMSGVCMIVTRRKEAELARLSAAEEASRLKDEFLATLSHELRTPLNAILGWVQVLQASGIPMEQVRQAVDVIGRNAKLQAQLIEDILDVSRIISGKLEIDRAPLTLPPLIETAVSGAMPAAQAKHIDLVKDVPLDLPQIDGDLQRVHQVLNNVLSNAVKFTPDHGHVRVRATVSAGYVEVEVADSGVGIDPAFLPFVFDRFRQADSRSTRRHGGLGLGLAITRHLMDLHDGDIRASSDGPGCGTVVTVRFPVRLAPDVHADSALHAEAEVHLRLEGVTVLVVDDQPDSRSLLDAILHQRGATVLQCDGAERALGMLSSEAVHLLVADIAMPDVDGYELIRRVRTTHRDLPAIAVTAFARPEDRRRALGAGYTGYTAKPIEAQQFLRTVRSTLGAPSSRQSPAV